MKTRHSISLWAVANLALICAYAQRAPVVTAVRKAINAGDLSKAAELAETELKTNGNTPGALEALSWVGRGNLAAKNYDAAEKYAAETRKNALELLKSRKLDDDTALPLALGASIEVQSHVMAARGQRSEAVEFLQVELHRWHDTSIRTRIQKNIHLISLEGKPAPTALVDVKDYVGSKAPDVSAIKGKPVILFFWAHWCPDCKEQGPVLAKLAQEHASKGLVVIGPTQLYGYAARGEDAPPAQETKYIAEVLANYYGNIQGMTAPLSGENFKRWGASTTPTLVLIDRGGIVRLYHPGKMTYEELAPLLQKIL